MAALKWLDSVLAI